MILRIGDISFNYSAVPGLLSKVDKSDRKQINITTTQETTTVLFTTPFVTGETWLFSGKPLCLIGTEEQWFTVSNRGILGFTLQAPIGATFECVCEKIY